MDFIPCELISSDPTFLFLALLGRDTVSVECSRCAVISGLHGNNSVPDARDGGAGGGVCG